MRKLLTTALLAVALSASPAASAFTVREIVDQANPGVARLSLRDTKDKEVGVGSGFVISADGRLVTNHHVIQGVSRIVAEFGEHKEVEVVGIRAHDAKVDVAVLQLAPGTYTPLTFATVPAARGDEIVVIGSPLGLDGSISPGFVANVRPHGTMRKRDDGGMENWGLQITATVTSGSSGSPILSTSAEVVGVVVGKSADGALHFGVPVAWFQHLLAASNTEVLPLKALEVVHDGPPVRTNLLISAGVFGALALVWWVASWRSRRATRVVTRGWK